MSDRGRQDTPLPLAPFVPQPIVQRTATQPPPRYDPPELGDYIKNYIDRNVAQEDSQNELCAICRSRFGAEPFTENLSLEDLTVVRLRPCNHLFHDHCIATWLNGVADSRNKCPLCRTELCQLNMLTPIIVAHDQANSILEHLQPWWDEELFIALLTFINEQFEAQGPGGAANYVPIPRMARDYWQARGNPTINFEHEYLGLRWVEVFASEHLDDLVRNHDLQTTWPGSQFVGLNFVIQELFAPLRQDMQEAADRIRLETFQEHGSFASQDSTVADDTLYQVPGLQGARDFGDGSDRRSVDRESEDSEASTVVAETPYRARFLGGQSPGNHPYGPNGHNVFVSEQLPTASATVAENGQEAVEADQDTVHDSPGAATQIQDINPGPEDIANAEEANSNSSSDLSDVPELDGTDADLSTGGEPELEGPEAMRQLLDSLEGTPDQDDGDVSQWPPETRTDEEASRSYFVPAVDNLPSPSPKPKSKRAGKKSKAPTDRKIAVPRRSKAKPAKAKQADAEEEQEDVEEESTAKKPRRITRLRK